MKARKLVLEATIMGYPTNIATVRIGFPAKEMCVGEYTELVCPNDNKPLGKSAPKPAEKTEKKTEPAPQPEKREPMYRCTCGFTATTWQQLKRVVKGTSEELQMPTLTVGNGEVEKARIFKIPEQALAKSPLYIDPSDAEHPITIEDEGSMVNLFKTMVAARVRKEVIFVRWNDTKEQVIAMLTTTRSGDIVLSKIIPTNVVRIGNRLSLDETKVSEKDRKEAEMFLDKMIPQAERKDLEITDYRVAQFKVHQTEDAKVTAIASIMEKHKDRKEIIDNATKREILVVPQAQQKKKSKKKD